MSAKSEYLKGHYLMAAEAENTVQSISYKVGGLVFTGQHQKARLLAEEYQQQVDLESLVIINFHLGLSYTRTSDYKKARSYFSSNIKMVRQKTLSAVAQFYAFQGIAFYRFFFSQHKRSQRYAEKGYACLITEKNSPPLLLALSLDIQGHNLIQLGFIYRGLKSLGKALEITEKDKLIHLNSEIQISKLIYESEYDHDSLSQIETLKSTLSSIESKNDYSKAELVLQISKLMMLTGQFAKANSFLTDHFDVIYQNENKRKIAKLNTLLAQLLLKRGQFIEALSVAKVAQRNLDEKTDVSLLLPILGLEIAVLKLMDKDVSLLKQKIMDLAQSVDRNTNLRIQSRTYNLPWSANRGEDKLGDLFDDLKKQDGNALKKVVEFKLLGLIPFYFDIEPGQKAIVMSHLKNHIFTLGHDEIHCSENSLSKTQLEILQLLQVGRYSKEDIIHKVWGYQYDPLRHDSLVYTAIARLRKVLGPHKNWILADENTYSLADDVKVVAPDFKHKPKAKVASSGALDQLAKLNFRQLEMLHSKEQQPLSVSQYGERWQVTRMTALRDLKTLCQKGLARKVGQGKATRYYIAEQ